MLRFRSENRPIYLATVRPATGARSRRAVTTRPRAGAPGLVITATIGDEDRRFLLGNRELVAARDDIDVFSDKSPLGTAIIGLRTGETTSYQTPTGKPVSVMVRDIEEYTDHS